MPAVQVTTHQLTGRTPTIAIGCGGFRLTPGRPPMTLLPDHPIFRTRPGP